ncbi:MAG: TIM barrel protein [Kiritimatiellae bacterium]|nr:TIM barrel protein [Kiritimatiellia bacterium]
MHCGLVSISFRELTARQIVDAVVEAGLDGIEWGGDIHAPHGDLTRAHELDAMTREAGLRVASYGSYYRAGFSESQGLQFERVLDSARALQAPTIRIWAGVGGSTEMDTATRAGIVEDSLRVARMAREQGLSVAFEYHRNTLTDTRASVSELLRETEAAGLECYWQPPVGWSRDERLASLRDLGAALANVHVFQWDAGGDRHPLADGADDWREYLDLANAARPRPDNQPRWALMEFVRDNTLVQFQRDAAVLRRLLANHGQSHGS